MALSNNSARAALVVAHPSHELRVHGWLEQTRPYVCVLTDGGGRRGEARLSRTSEVLTRAGAAQGTIYGRLTDLEVYTAILSVERSEDRLHVTAWIEHTTREVNTTRSAGSCDRFEF